ncbi:DoxX family protein [Leptothoe spongobia]|uniref:DoxX family protein n=1 Tax=Leptothoe spongobia TAU-MAC 1115 TaxID=1967444 RepID=A0A947GJF9_9CYAN|nr:DoxX family protein [Leptothoe spongobia]MBT9316524.1 DoxX family protein [Leptothoe spongobia TAU-MAC 1115]
MKLTIRDIPNTAPRNQRLTKPTIELETAPYAITLLRVSLGILFLAHGLLKVTVFTLPGTAQFFQSVGLPGFMAYMVTPIEIVGGLLLILGLYTRWVALALFPILLVATFKVHGGSGWLFTNEGGGWEFPAFFAITTIIQFLLGDGAYALSSQFTKR